MITAQQARELMESKPIIGLPALLNRIESRAKLGYDFTWVEESRISGPTQKILTELGYIIKEDETHSFKISW